MEVRRLYYEDCHLETFAARVLDCQASEGLWQVTLDATAFYPGGGGQPCDLGTLGEARVLSAREQGEQILHLCDRPLQPGQTVTGRIDYDRRFDFMQQHTGEHILSGILFAAHGVHNTGFHMGADTVTVDFDGVLPPEALEEAEARANRIIWKNAPLRCWYPEPEELRDLAYRSKRQLPWPVRIVEIPDCDRCACCGVHTAATGEVGLIKLLSCVRFRQGVRIEMVCGGRALALLSQVYEQNRQVSHAFSAKILETGQAARRMNEQLAAEKFRASGLERQIFDGVAAGYAGKGDVAHFARNVASDGARELAERIAAVCGGTAAVLTSREDGSWCICLVNKNAGAVAQGRTALAALGGRGGGRDGFFQGTVSASRAEIEDYFRQNGWMLNP